MVGGRDYGRSQLNHVLAKRQPGSSFKPFVYAAALNSGVDGSQPLITPATVLNDEPTTFQFGDRSL
jgi:penicillin-binding protein 1B